MGLAGLIVASCAALLVLTTLAFAVALVPYKEHRMSRVKAYIAQHRKAIVAAASSLVVVLAASKGKSLDIGVVTAAIAGFLTWLVPNTPAQGA